MTNKAFQIMLIHSVLFSSILFAQPNNHFGVKAHLNVSNFTETDVFIGPGFELPNLAPEKRAGAGFSIFYKYFPISNLCIEPSLGYLQKGGEWKFKVTTIEEPDGTGETLRNDEQLDYLQLEVNVLPGLDLAQTRLSGLLGIYGSYLLQSRSFTIRPRDYKKMVGGFNLGFQLSKDILERFMLLEFVYSKDISDVLENTPRSIKTETFRFSIGIGI